jgi:hypothetical protein
VKLDRWLFVPAILNEFRNDAVQFLGRDYSGQNERTPHQAPFRELPTYVCQRENGQMRQLRRGAAFVVAGKPLRNFKTLTTKFRHHCISQSSRYEGSGAQIRRSATVISKNNPLIRKNARHHGRCRPLKRR